MDIQFTYLFPGNIHIVQFDYVLDQISNLQFTSYIIQRSYPILLSTDKFGINQMPIGLFTKINFNDSIYSSIQSSNSFFLTIKYMNVQNYALASTTGSTNFNITSQILKDQNNNVKYLYAIPQNSSFEGVNSNRFWINQISQNLFEVKTNAILSNSLTSYPYSLYLIQQNITSQQYLTLLYVDVSKYINMELFNRISIPLYICWENPNDNISLALSLPQNSIGIKVQKIYNLTSSNYGSPQNSITFNYSEINNNIDTLTNMLQLPFNFIMSKDQLGLMSSNYLPILAPLTISISSSII